MTPLEIYDKLCKVAIDPEVVSDYHIFFHNGKKHIFNRDYINHTDGKVTGFIMRMNRFNYIVHKQDFEITTNSIKPEILKKFASKHKILK